MQQHSFVFWNALMVVCNMHLEISGFKQGDDDALEEFYALSKAHFQVLGKKRIDEKFEFLTEHFEDLFTSYWINVGRQYIYGVGEFV